MPENNATLKKKNQELREQVNALSQEIRKLKEHITEHTSSPERSAAQSTETVLQFYSDAHDQSQTFQADVSKELKRLSTWLSEISTRVDEIGKAIHSMCEYSYQYNVKIVGLPELANKSLTLKQVIYASNYSLIWEPMFLFTILTLHIV